LADIKEPLFISNKWVGEFSVASNWCGRADLMRAEGGEAVRGGPELLQREKPNPEI
jgi:hypothetical protein